MEKQHRRLEAKEEEMRKFASYLRLCCDDDGEHLGHAQLYMVKMYSGCIGDRF